MVKWMVNVRTHNRGQISNDGQKLDGIYMHWKSKELEEAIKEYLKMNTK